MAEGAYLYMKTVFLVICLLVNYHQLTDATYKCGAIEEEDDVFKNRDRVTNRIVNGETVSKLTYH